MRPLNRPMFKMGGPIKEGIMKGMKEPQAINTLGSPLAPTDSSGRQGYALPLMFLAGQAARMALRPLGQFAMRKFAGPNLPMIGGKRLLTMAGGKPPPIPAGFGKEQMIFNPTGFGRYILGSPEAKAIGAVAKGSGKIGGTIKKVGTGLAKSPLTLGFLGYQGLKALGPDGEPVETAKLVAEETALNIESKKKDLDQSDVDNIKPDSDRKFQGRTGGVTPNSADKAPNEERDIDSYAEARSGDIIQTSKSFIDDLVEKGFTHPLIKQVSPDFTKMWFIQDNIDYIAYLNSEGISMIEKGIFHPTIEIPITNNHHEKPVESDDDE